MKGGELMKHTFFTVGPSQIYPTVPKYVKEAVERNILSLSHRSGEFKNMFSDVVENIKQLLSIPSDYEIVFLPSATEAMERTLQGVVEKESFHIVHGAFGKKFKEIADDLGKKASVYQLDITGFADEIEIPKSVELVCLTQSDTSNGSWISPEFIYQIKKKYPEKLIAIDIVSSVPIVNLDFSKVDIAFFSVQKGFGLPAGLGVMVISPDAYKKAQQVKDKGYSIGSYHSLLSLIQQAKKFQTPETPNVLGIFLFKQVLRDMLEKGIGTIRKQADIKASMLYEFFDQHQEYKPVITHPDFRSSTVIVVEARDTETIHTRLSKEGMKVGKGYGSKEDDHIRIANFPSHTVDQIEMLIQALS